MRPLQIALRPLHSTLRTGSMPAAPRRGRRAAGAASRSSSRGPRRGGSSAYTHDAGQAPASLRRLRRLRRLRAEHPANRRALLLVIFGASAGRASPPPQRDPAVPASAFCERRLPARSARARCSPSGPAHGPVRRELHSLQLTQLSAPRGPYACARGANRAAGGSRDRSAILLITAT